MTDTDEWPEPGTLFVDREDEPSERGTVVLLRPVTNDERVLRANEHEPDALGGQTVADVNPSEYATNPVVEVAFEGWLNSHIGEWRGLLDDYQSLDDPEPSDYYDLLSSYATEWGIPKQVYAYPLGRLMPRPYCENCQVRAEYVETHTTHKQLTADGWAGAGYYCLTPACPETALVGNADALHTLDERDPESAEVDA